jgi:hypothetical protein
MADDATLAHRFMLINPWAALGAVTLKAGVVLAEKLHATAADRLRKVCPAAFDCISLVRVMTVGATDPTFQNRMMVRQLELRSHFHVTLETGLR